MSFNIGDILSQMDKDVNEKITTLFGVVEAEDNSHRFITDLTIQPGSYELPKKTSHAEPLQEYAQISSAYNKLLERGEANKLSDSFRTKEVKEPESRTARSFTQTLASYGRYISLLQATT